MSKSDQKLRELFNEILFFLWDVSTGVSENQREAFEGATRYSRFLVSELERRKRLKRAGETAVFRRGKAIPDSLINAWAWNILEDCRYHQIPPPRAMLKFLYHQLGCTHLSPRQPITSEETKQRARTLVAMKQSIRSVAKRFDVNPSTVMRWVREDPKQFDQELYSELRRLTNVTRFYPSSWLSRVKAPEKRSGKRKTSGVARITPQATDGKVVHFPRTTARTRNGKRI
jgi:hypothetical protein